MPATYTPIRYPGGKTRLHSLVKSLIETNRLEGDTYVEPFAGGAGLACKLLLLEEVPSIILNDYDRAVYCMWDSIVNDSSDLCEFVQSAPLNIEFWLMQRDIYRNRDTAEAKELGFASFYLNRTNVSGILNGGVIGGIGQTGKYKIDCRFNRDNLQKKILRIGEKRDQIELYNLDAEVFVESVLMDRDSVFCYLDPPYVQKGPGLYRSSFNEGKHRSLASLIQSCKFPWMATYDCDDLIDELYGDNIECTYDIAYSAYQSSIGKEKLILPKHVKYIE